MNPDLNTLYAGDCVEVMKTWPDNFVDTIITDPPYGLEFMGKAWDGDVPGIKFWAEMLRVSKPGALLLSFGGTRTWHHLAMAIEGAGWQIRDCLMWLYGSGFPKSLDISKAIDKAKGAEREVIGVRANHRPKAPQNAEDADPSGFQDRSDGLLTVPATDLARHWSGYGTALKPAWEPIIVAMKPLDGTFAENAERWGVAGINVDGGRIGTHEMTPKQWESRGLHRSTGNTYGEHKGSATPMPTGRWPANLLLDEEAAGMLDQQTESKLHGAGFARIADRHGEPKGMFPLNGKGGNRLGDSGGASRFFYVAKSSRSERNAGCGELPKAMKYAFQTGDGHSGKPSSIELTKSPNRHPTANNHPTVKPLNLMKYLCTLTRTPTGGGGIVLDPFAGSGTTLLAAESQGRPWLGIEMNAEYRAIAEARVAYGRTQIKLAV